MDNYDGYVKIGTKIDTKELKDQLQNVQKSLKDAGEYFKSLGKEGAASFKEIESQFKSIDASAKITGNEIKAIGDKKEVLQKKIDSLIKSGLKPEDLQIKALKKTYEELTKAQEINTKQTEAKSKTLKQTLGNIKTSYLAVTGAITAGVLVVSKFVKLLGSLNDAYMVQQSAERALATAAKNNPYLNDRSIQRLKAYASELQKVSNYGDEVTIGLMTQLAAAGRTEAEIQKIIKASADLAASGTTTFDGAVRNLNKTFSGLSGELGEVIPELKNLTAEQMKNGDAVDLIAKKYAGMALSVVDKSVQIQNALGDLKEGIGEIGASTGLTDIFQNSLLAITEWYTSGIEMFNDWVRRMRGTKEYSLEVLKETREQRQAQIEEERAFLRNLNEQINNESDKNRKNLLMNAFEMRMTTLAQLQDGLAMLDTDIAKKEKEIKENSIETVKEISENEKKQIDGRIAAQQQYEAAVNLATEKQKGGLITLEEKWDDIKSAASAYTDALINLGYTYEETATIGGKALEDMRRKLTGNDLSKGLGFAGVIGGEGFLNPLVKIAEQWKLTIPEISGLMEDGAEEAVSSFNKALGDNENSSLLAIKGFTKNVASAFSAGLSIAKNIVSGIFTAIKALATFSPSDIIADITKTIEGLTEFFTIELPLLPVYFNSGSKIIKEFLRGMIEGLPNTVETIKNVLSEIFENIKENIEEDATSALTVASALLLAIVSALPEAIETIGAIASGLVSAIVTIAPELIKGIVEGLIEILPVALDTIIDFLNEWWDTIPDLAGSLVEVIVGMVPDLVSLLIQSIPKILQLMNPLNAEMIALWMEILAKIIPSLFVLPANLWAGIILGLTDLAIDMLDQLTLLLTDPDKWLETQTAVIDSMVEAFKEIPDKVWEQLKESFGKLQEKFTELFNKLMPVLEVIFQTDYNGDGVIGIKKEEAPAVTQPTTPITQPTTPITQPTTPITTPTAPIIPPIITTPTTENPKAPISGIDGTKLPSSERIIKIIKKVLGVTTEVDASGTKQNPLSLPSFLSLQGVKAADIVKIMALVMAGKVGSTIKYASGTDFAIGGRSIINEPYSELVELPTGSKVMTANATAGLVEQAVQSVMRGLGGFEGQQNQRPIVLHNYMESVMNVNGKVLGKIAFENIDRNVRMQYGN